MDCVCGQPLEDTGFIPIKRFSRSGVFAVASVRRYVCHTPDCESGGGMESWKAMGRLKDLADRIPDRPFYARHNPDTNDWVPVRVSIAPHGPDVSLDTDGRGAGIVHFQGQEYPFISYEHLLSQEGELPFKVHLIRLWPEASEEYWQVAVGIEEVMDEPSTTTG